MQTSQYVPIFLFLLATLTSATAQQVPFLNHYAWNPRLFNPAGQGYNGEGQVTAVYRAQFQNIEASVRPTTYLLHADLSPLVHERIGIAAQVMGDKTHLLSRFQFSGFFGYHLVRTPNFRFSLGAAAGIRSRRLDFSGRRVADVLDLAVFSDEVNAVRFDGGPGLALEYRMNNGSVLALDAATQVFGGDIRIQGTDNTAAVYTLVPHVLVNARYRYQGDRFAVEPTVAFRAMAGDRSLQSGLLDINLNAYFLKNDLLMAGIGMRTDQGGFRFQLGVAPTAAVRLSASAELHSTLGLTYEVGASYVFGKNRPASVPAPVSVSEEPAPPIAPATPVNLLQAEYAEARAFAQTLEAPIAALRAGYAAVETSMAAAGAAHSRQQQAADSCATLLTQTAAELRQIRLTANGINVKRLQAEQIVRTASGQGAPVSDETRATLLAIQEEHADINSQLSALETSQKNLQEQCAALRPQRNEATCIRSGDADCVQELFSANLTRVPGVPANGYPLRTFVFPGAAAVTFHYPDDEEAFALTPEWSALVRHIAAQIKQVEQQGGSLDNIALVTELQEDKNTLGYQLGLLYDGSLGNNPIAYSLVDNESAAAVSLALSLAAGSPISLEALGVLKLAALRAYLIRQGVPAGRITLQVRFNHSENIYREETKLIVKLRSN
ncbi:MAG: PorP/SprF family type IX secretion system membrane protein [Lewinellaceae bacterium]|nr:PorP/SprF family type IX secretion system membrane protein [Lewinellaceae bacterium]